LNEDALPELIRKTLARLLEENRRLSVIEQAELPVEEHGFSMN
jgi:hypothetical protein